MTSLLSVYFNMRLYSSLIRRCYLKSERGDVLIEVIIALAVIGLLGIALLNGFSTSLNAINVMDNTIIAKNLASNQIEYVDKLDYQYDATTYPLDAQLEIPDGWNVLPVSVEPLHATDDGIQKITVTVQHYGENVYALMVYKLDI